MSTYKFDTGMEGVDEIKTLDSGQGKKSVRHDTKNCSSCPFPSLTAYWTLPPTWPRRLLCENKYFALSLTRGCWVTLAALLLIYFLIMDIVLLARYRVTNLAVDSRAGHPGETYSPFTHLSVKAVLSDHVRHYIMTPSSEYFNAVTNFTSVFAFVTPNMVSAAHLFVAFVAGKFIASDNLQDRQIGVGLYFCRTWLDSFDGTVFRARSGVHLEYNSVYASFGYFIDALFDTLGGFFLSFGVLFYLFKRFGPVKAPVLPVSSKDIDDGALVSSLKYGQPAVNRKEAYSYICLTFKTISLGLSLSVAGICWDRAVKDFTYVFQTDLANTSLSILQFQLSHNSTTMVIFFLWRFISGQTVLTYAQIAIYMDKVWEFLHYMPWVLLAMTIPLYIITEMYISHVKHQLLL
ncbi:unnamed protein product [Lymnaea stagnalis]|uniref:Uncharacterized protein n=1 Tax=Lymnaea stagnalis TaxID=6523 RepID=A0AAV2HF60_LYMST